ncbi:MAG: hypothetical protein HC927_05750, partial [Deltaproteobacteria bacterium]|nr:hypothetical protein [Deltaproteobacteria bacterium]
LHLPRFNEQFRTGEAPDGHDALLRAARLPDGTAAHIISRHPIADQAYADQVLGYLRDDVRAFVVPLEDFDYGVPVTARRAACRRLFHRAGRDD